MTNKANRHLADYPTHSGNFYGEVRTHIDMMDNFMMRNIQAYQAGQFPFDDQLMKNAERIGSHNEDFSEHNALALAHSFLLKVSYHGKYDENTGEVIHPEDHEVLGVKVIYSRRRTVILMNDDPFFSIGSGSKIICTGSHQSCYFDSWEKPILDRLTEMVNRIVPEGAENEKRLPFQFNVDYGRFGEGLEIGLLTEFDTDDRNARDNYRYKPLTREKALAFAAETELGRELGIEAPEVDLTPMSKRL